MLQLLISTGFRTSGGEGGIRTLGTGVSPYNGLANRRIRPLCHLSDEAKLQEIAAQVPPVVYHLSKHRAITVMASPGEAQSGISPFILR